MKPPPPWDGADVKGSTQLSFTIIEDGTVRDVVVSKSSGVPVLDEYARECVTHVRYRPAMKNGKPAATPWKIEFQWRSAPLSRTQSNEPDKELEHPPILATTNEAEAPRSVTGTAQAGNPLDGLTLDQRNSIQTAFDRGRKLARHCFDAVSQNEMPTGFAVVNLTFDGSSGRISDAALVAPAGEPAIEACVKDAFVGQAISAFGGAPRISAFGYRPSDQPRGN